MLRVRRTVDTPGQVGPLQHALLVARHRPHAVIVLLDCSTESSATLRWFCLFCDALDSVLRKASSGARGLREIVVILNKRDQIENPQFTNLHQAVRETLERLLSVVWGAAWVRSIPILQCTSIRTGRGTALMDACVARLAARLAGRQDGQDVAAGPELVGGHAGLGANMNPNANGARVKGKMDQFVTAAGRAITMVVFAGELGYYNLVPLVPAGVAQQDVHKIQTNGQSNIWFFSSRRWLKIERTARRQHRPVAAPNRFVVPDDTGCAVYAW